MSCSVSRSFRFGRYIIDNVSKIYVHRNHRLHKVTTPVTTLLGHHYNRRMLATPANEAAVEDKKVVEPVIANVEETDSDKKYKLMIEELNKEVAELTAAKAELDDKYKRALADGENLRKRLSKQIQDAKLFGIQGFCKDLLEVADILGKATECVPKEEVCDNNPHLKNLYEGLTMTEAELKKVFQRNGLCAVNPLNEKFDPNLHEALFQQEVQGKTAGTVVVVSKIGYKLHDRCIRPALVGVAKGA